MKLELNRQKGKKSPPKKKGVFKKKKREATKAAKTGVSAKIISGVLAMGILVGVGSATIAAMYYQNVAIPSSAPVDSEEPTIKNTAYSDHFLSFFLQFSFFFPIILFIGGVKLPVVYRCKLRTAH